MKRFGAVGMVGLLAMAGTSGCTNKMAGQIALGIVGAVAAAAAKGIVNGAIESATSSGRSISSDETRRTLSVCEQLRGEWREDHPDQEEALPRRLRCTPEGDFPGDTTTAIDEAPVTEAAAARTGVTTNVCGGGDTGDVKCVQPRTPMDVF